MKSKLISPCILLSILLLTGITPHRSSDCGTDVEEQFLILEVQDHRREERAAGTGTEPITIETESTLTLFGHIYVEEYEDTLIIKAFNDSIKYQSYSPFALKTFMSRDTMYYSTLSGPNVVSRDFHEGYDTMLTCLFTGPAVEIQSQPTCPRHTIKHLKDECRSGQYDRLDLPYALGTFYIDAPVPLLEKGFQWVEKQVYPSYTGLGYRPEMQLYGRVIQASNGRATAVLSSDTTFNNVQLTLPNGEYAVILADTVHIGGTVTLDAKSGLPIRGEMRVEETLRIARPRLSDHVLSKECAYILRFTIN